MEFTEEYLNGIFNETRHKYYKKVKTHYRDMAVHVSGGDTKHIIDQKRPNEPEHAKDYRLKAYKPTTKSEFEKVLSIISRIFNERLFGIKWPESSDENSLENYLSKKYPFYRSLMNYVRQILLKRSLEDPNGVLVIAPTDFETKDNQFYVPIPIIYNSDQVLDFSPGKYFIFDLTEYTKMNNDRVETILIIDEEKILRLNKKKEIETEFEFSHDLGEPPCFRLGGNIVDDEPPYCYESFVSGVLPHWDKAVMTQSDLDAMVILHMYPEKWEMETECQVCNGTGQVMDKYHSGVQGDPEKERKINCRSCQGKGTVNKSPFEIFTVKKDILENEVKIPIPPMGYVERDTNTVQEVRSILQEQIDKGLEAINMDIVKRVGENQSGIAKTIDRQELYTFLQRISDHFFDYIIPNIIEFTWKWRQGYLGGDYKKQEPTIIKPVMFDVLNAQMLMQELSQAKEADIDNSVIVALQKSIIDKMFTGDVKDKLMTSLELDPFPGMNTDDIVAFKGMSRVISDEQIYIKANLAALIEELSEQEGFLDKEYTEKQKLIFDLAKKKLVEQQKQMIDVPGESRQDPGRVNSFNSPEVQ